MPAKKRTQKRKTVRRQHRLGSCLMGLTVGVILLSAMVVMGISYYMFVQAVKPNIFGSDDFCNSTVSEDELLLELKSDYPFIKRWLKVLKANNLLKEMSIYAANDSTPLHAYYIPAHEPTANTAILVHGYTDQALSMLPIAYLYQHDLRFNVLLPDLRTHGKSGGTHIGFGWNDSWDVLQWMEVANELFGKDFGGQTNMVVHGVSMGAATTMFVAGRNTHNYVKAYIEDCGYSNVYDEISYVAQRDFGLSNPVFLSLASHFCQWSYGWNFKEASCVEALKTVDTPMLFIHGTADRYVPFDMVHELYDAKPSNKDIWEVKDVIHARSYHDQHDEYTKKVGDFINQYLYNGQ